MWGYLPPPCPWKTATDASFGFLPLQPQAGVYHKAAFNFLFCSSRTSMVLWVSLDHGYKSEPSFEGLPSSTQTLQLDGHLLHSTLNLDPRRAGLSWELGYTVLSFPFLIAGSFLFPSFFFTPQIFHLIIYSITCYHSSSFRYPFLPPVASQCPPISADFSFVLLKANRIETSSSGFLG